MTRGAFGPPVSRPASAPSRHRLVASAEAPPADELGRWQRGRRGHRRYPERPITLFGSSCGAVRRGIEDVETVNEAGTDTGATGTDRAGRHASSAWGGRIRSLRAGLGAEMPSEEGSRRGPLAVVALAVGFNLWVLRGEILPVRQLNDSSVHQLMIQWAIDRMHAGHLPFDGWFPYLGLGSSLFHHYQSLGHILTGVLGLAIGSRWAFSGTLYLLLVTWPISVYLGARLMGWDRWTAAGAALVSPLIVSTPGYGYEHGSYTWRGLGVWSQLWGMWLLPLAWGFSWRAISGRSKTLAIAALFVGLTVACHFITGYMALLVLPIWVLIKPSEFLKRLKRAAVVGIGGLLVISWVIVPLLLDAKFSTLSEYLRGTFWTDSYGASKVFGWLLSGKLFDGSDQFRLPVVSLLVLLGAGVCVIRFRSDERGRALLCALALALVLYSGRSPFGPIINLIPGNTDLFLQRLIIGVHMAGVLLAGVGVGWIIGMVRHYLPVFQERSKQIVAALAIVVVGLLVLSPAWLERASYDAQGDVWLDTQRQADAAEGLNVDALIAEAKQAGPGRLFGGKFGDTSPDRVYSVPIYGYLLADQADSIGFNLRTSSMSSDVETLFDPTNAASYNMFNVRYVILPAGTQPAVPAKLLDTKGAHALWQVPTTGFLDVVDVLFPITADRTNLAAAVQPWITSALPAQGRYPAIAFAGGPPPAPTTLPQTGAAGPPGTVLDESASLESGTVSGTVNLSRPGMVVLKASFDPRWTVTVDGQSLPTQMIAPSFVGREVPAGQHTIVFAYRSFQYYDVLFLLGGLVFVGLLFGPRLWPRAVAEVRRRRQPA